MTIATYQSVAPTRFLQLEAEANALMGIPIKGNVGNASAHGVSIGWVYDPDTQQLAFTLISKPFYVSIGVIKSHLDQLINGVSV